jgi:hypothetical protein
VKKVLLVAAVLAVFFYLDRERPDAGDPAANGMAASPATESAAPGDDPIAEAYASRTSGVAVSGRGSVTRILGDDSLGDRHQRFVLELHSGQTLLIAHNIDLAPRVEALREGDLVEFSGEYGWNDKGGVVHWTHQDPDGRRPGGWLRHRGRTYE